MPAAALAYVIVSVSARPRGGNPLIDRVRDHVDVHDRERERAEEARRREPPERSRPDRARDGPRGGWFPRCKAPGVSVTGQALEGTQRQDDQHEQRGPDQKRLAPAERGHERLPQRDEAERAEARSEERRVGKE